MYHNNDDNDDDDVDDDDDYDEDDDGTSGNTYRLRSCDTADYILPRTRTKFGERGFHFSGPAGWNTLPSDLHDITDTNVFKKRLKTALFDRAY